MRRLSYLTFALVTAAGFAGGASAANICQAENLTCATTMPIGGYCECTARGQTQGGTVVTRAELRQSRTAVNSTAGGCGAQPNAPGCR
jgi:hypothetical protein